MGFPIDFVWGAAAASYQVEGAAREEGKGLSVWDTFCQQPGKIADGTTGDVSCDHYHRYAEDARLMGQIGLKAYRFSVSWPRVLPGGIGPANEKGLDFYDRLVDALLENGVQPWVTLFHWDYPHALFRRGGWLNPDSSDWFAEYAGVVVDRLSDRVTHWMTLNEPQIFITFGHQTGYHAPGIVLPVADLLVAAHNVLLAHGKAVGVTRARARAKPTVGAAPMAPGFIPASDSPETIEAARAWMFAVQNRDFLNTTWFADPMVVGRYPDDGLRLFEADLPPAAEHGMDIICQPLDFYGVNIYTGRVVAVDDDGPRLEELPDGYASTAMRHIMPPALYWGPRFLHERYGLPIVITENGMANLDWVQRHGKVHDSQRIDYLARYLGALRRAIDDDVDVRGYFHWTTTDNFEWALGYQKRFGLVHVDFTTGERVLKDSAYWYRDVITSNGQHI